MARTERGEIAEYLTAMGQRFLPVDGVGAGSEAEPSVGVDVQALLDRLAIVNAAPRKRLLRHNMLTAPDRFATSD
jgi:hypothetical protein